MTQALPAYQTRSRRVWYVYTAAWSFVGALSWTTAAVFFVRDVGMSPLQLVLTGTALEVAYFVSEIPTGVVADLYSRRLSLVVSAAVTGVAMVLTGLAHAPWLVVAAAALWGFGWTFRTGAEDAWLADEVGLDALPGIYQRSAQVGRVAGLAGIAAAVGLAAVSLRLPLLVSGALAVALAGYLVARMREHTFVRPEREPATGAFGAAMATAAGGWRAVQAAPVLGMVLLVAVFLGAWSEGFDRLWEAHLLLDLQLSGTLGMSEVTWFGVLGAGTLTLSFLVAAPMLRRVSAFSLAGTARWLLVLYLALGVTALGFALAGSVLLAVAAYWGAAVVRGLAEPAFHTWANSSIADSRYRATVLSIMGVAGSFGEWTGGPVLGAAGTRWTVRVALAAGTSLLAPVVLLLARAVRHHGRVA
ncbi:MAG TPA: MFS transporter [Dermatophilaceae bacterium]|nr:MFS transporter [Dermatophilaceae bacterium]